MKCNSNLCGQDEAKKAAAAELLKYNDTFNKMGFTGLSMKNATPAAIEEVVGMSASILVCRA